MPQIYVVEAEQHDLKFPPIGAFSSWDRAEKCIREMVDIKQRHYIATGSGKNLVLKQVVVWSCPTEKVIKVIEEGYDMGPMLHVVFHIYEVIVDV